VENIKQMSTEHQRIYNEAYLDKGNTSYARRKLNETLRRICNWINKELSSPEPIPQEFTAYLNKYETKKLDYRWHHIY